MNERPKMNYAVFVQAASAVVTAVALVLVLFGILEPAASDNEATARGTSNFDEIDLADGTASDPAFGFTDDTDNGMYRVGANNIGFAAGGALVADINSSGLDMNSNTISGLGGVTLSNGDFTVADDLKITPQTAITVTNGAAFTATGTLQYIQAASEVTPTITAGAAGDLLVIINTSNQTINIADTGNQVLTAAAALGQYDSLTLLADGTRWIEIARANN